MTQTLTAQDLFRAAYENRYTWDSEFPRYQTKITLEDTKATHIGQIQVKAAIVCCVVMK